MFTVEKMHVTFDKEKVLSIDTPIDIQYGDRLAVIGSNGAGKSTFVKACLNLIDYQGNINTLLKDKQIAVHFQENKYSDRVSTKLLIEMILQTNIKTNKKLQEMISHFEFEELLKKRFNQLSGGQKQRLTLILVLMQEAELTFFDEVTSGLDFETRMNLMRKLNDYYAKIDKSMVLISHYYQEIEMLAVNKIMMLEKGEVVFLGNPKELFQKYCGKAIYIVSHDSVADIDTSQFSTLESPDHLVAFTVKDEKQEQELIQFLTHNHIDFKRSEQDIELLAYNARRQFLEAKGEK